MKEFQIHATNMNGLGAINVANAIIKSLIENKNIRVHWGSWDADTEMFLTSLGFDVIRFARKDNARDMMHFGVKSHKFLAEQMYNKIKDNAI